MEWIINVRTLDMRRKLRFLLLFGTVLAGFVPALRAQEARWVITHSWEGQGTRQTRMFPINGTRWKIRHKHTGRGLFQISVYDEEGNLLDLAANLSEPIAGVTTLPGRGKRYLAISGINTEWEVTVEQYLSVIEEWQLTQVMQKPDPPLRKLATWFGGDADVEYELAVSEGSWKIVHSNTGGGVFQVIVRGEDQERFVALAANTSEPEESESWVHRNGAFHLRIKAENTEWKVDVYGR